MTDLKSQDLNLEYFIKNDLRLDGILAVKVKQAIIRLQQQSHITPQQPQTVNTNKYNEDTKDDEEDKKKEIMDNIDTNDQQTNNEQDDSDIMCQELSRQISPIIDNENEEHVQEPQTVNNEENNVDDEKEGKKERIDNGQNENDIINDPVTAGNDDEEKETKKRFYISRNWVISIVIGFLGIITYFFINNSWSVSSEDIPEFYCPNDKYFISLRENDKMMNVSHSDHHMNTRYFWDISDKPCDSMVILGEDTDTLKLWDFADCDPHQISVKLLFSVSINGYNYNKECNVSLMFEEVPIFGIDLGTTYSCISMMKKDGLNPIIIIADKAASKECIPSAVYFDKDKRIKIGHDALNKLIDDPLSVVYDIKRVIGRTDDIETFKENHPSFNISTDNKHIFIPNLNEYVLFEQILSILLSNLVSIASKRWYIEYNVNDEYIHYIRDVVVSIPATFHNGQRKAIRSSSHLSGLNAQKLISEPSAASLAYSYYNKMSDEELKSFLTFDFGGGTLDCSVMRCSGVYCEVLSVGGNNKLGGCDFDHVIRNIIIHKFQQQHTINITDIYSNIIQIAERIKIHLTNFNEYNLTLNNKSVIITRKEFEQHPKTRELIKLSIDAVHDTINNTLRIENKKQKINIRSILMIGGTSKIPIIQKTLKNEFNNITLVFPRIDAQLMVVHGAGIIAHSLAFNHHKTDNYTDIVADVIPLSLGVSHCIVDEDNPLNPDGTVNTICDVMNILLPKNTRFNEKKIISMCQEHPNDTTLILELYEGDNYYVVDNYFLGEIEITDIESRDEDITDNILFSFEIDTDGIATAKATTNPKYGRVKEYKLITHEENAKNGSITKENVKKLKENMISWYTTNNFNLLINALNDDIS